MTLSNYHFDFFFSFATTNSVSRPPRATTQLVALQSPVALAHQAPRGVNRLPAPGNVYALSLFGRLPCIITISETHMFVVLTACCARTTWTSTGPWWTSCAQVVRFSEGTRAYFVHVHGGFTTVISPQQATSSRTKPSNVDSRSPL